MSAESRVEAAIVIPARLESRRFHRKVLARETGKYLIQHVYEEVKGTRGVRRVVVATDSAEVAAAARSFDAEVCMTSPHHISGTDRVAEVARGLDEGIVVNVQGDEPLASRDDLARLVDALQPRSASGAAWEAPVMATLARRRTDDEGFSNPNVVKVVIDDRGKALYFSRASIPHRRDGAAAGDGPPEEREWLQHIGVYGFRRDFLATFTSLAPGRLEKREKLEQLRVLENGFAIHVLTTDHPYRGIDTEEEYREFVETYRASTREEGT